MNTSQDGASIFSASINTKVGQDIIACPERLEETANLRSLGVTVGA